MSIALYQIIIPLLCVVMLAGAFSHLMRGERTIREFIAISAFWGLLGVVAVFPDTTRYLSLVLGIKSNVNAILFIAIGILGYLALRSMIQQEKLEQEVTKLVRAIALKDRENDKK